MRRVDVLNRGNHLADWIGPIRLPSRDAFVAAMVTLAEIGPQTRVGLTIDPRTGDWVYDRASLRAQCDNAVTEVPIARMEDFRRLHHEWALSSDPSDPPLRYVLAGDHLVQLIDHRVGDVGLIMRLPAAILAIAAGEDPPDWTSEASMRDPLIRALSHTFLSHPRNIGTLLRARAAEHSVNRHQNPDHNQVAHDPAVTWVSDPTFEAVVIPADTVTCLRSHLRAELPGVSFTAMVATMLHASLPVAGLEVSNRMTFVQSARDFLPPGTTTYGNFITGIGVRVAPGDGPADVQRQLDLAQSTFRPLAALGAGALSSRWRRQNPSPVAPTHPIASLTFSNAGAQPALNSLPWTAAQGGDATFALGPTAPEQVSGTVFLIDGSAHVSVSFDAGVFPRKQITRALETLIRSAELVAKYRPTTRGVDSTQLSDAAPASAATARPG